MKTIGMGALIFCLFVCVLEPTGAQSIHGRILVEGDTLGVDGADLALIDSTGASLLLTQSDSLGMFRIAVPEAGRYEIMATRLGFASVQVEVVVREREIVDVELRLAEEAIPLDPIVVVARREIRRGTLDEFYDRMDRNKQRGVGWFFTKEEIERRELIQLPIFLQSAPGVFLETSGGPPLMRHQGDYCSPTIFIDGLETSYRELQLIDMEGIEVYRGRFETPAGYFPSDCGMIFLWRSPDWGNPFSWGRVAIAGGLLAILVALAAVF